MIRSTLRRSSAAAVAVLALASLAACGGDDSGDDGGDGDATSSESSDAPGDASDDPAGSEGAEESGDPESTDGTEGTDPEEEVGDEIEPDEFIDVYLDAMDRATTATLEMNFGGPAAIQGSGSADFSTTPPSMKLKVKDAGTGTKQEMIIVDGIMYLGMTPKTYMSYDLSDPNSPLGTDLTDQLDPTAMAEVFEEGITRASYVGEEEVDGESMERYQVILDSAALLDKADAPLGSGDAIGDELTFDIWFDGDGMFRRQVAGLGGVGAGSVELNYDNWGEPVDIKAPPKSQITKLPGA